MGWLTSVISAISSLKFIIEAAISLWKFVSDFFTKRGQNQTLDEMKKAEDELEKANSIQDDQERLKKKAEEACKIEKAVNPNADC